jgi:hypothetical protein
MNNVKTYINFLHEEYNQAVRSDFRNQYIYDLLNRKWLNVSINTNRYQFVECVLQIEFFIQKYERNAVYCKTYIIQLLINEDNTMTFARDQYLADYWYKIKFKKEESEPLMKKVLKTIDDEIKEDPSIVKKWKKNPEPFLSKYPEIFSGKELGLL